MAGPLHSHGNRYPPGVQHEHASPWLHHGLLRLVGALLVAGVIAGGTLVLTRMIAKSPAEPPRREAIRVDCRDGAACALAEEVALDVWSERRALGEPIDVVVDAAALAELAAGGARWTVLDPDIDATAGAEAARLRAHVLADGGDWFAEFRDYTAIEAHIEELAAMAPSRASVHGIGSTLDGRTLWALRIGGQSPDALPMLINGAQHAREWISAMSATCIADRLVRDYDSDPRIRSFVDSTEAWIVPVVNPDGYQYSWGQDRYWRKNRRGGYGVDLNRNFSVAWGGAGSSALKRSQVYRGDRPFSENESAALRALAKREGIRAHVDLHAYGQLLLFPWNHGEQPTDDHARFAGIGDEMASAIYAQHKNGYRLLRGVELYPAAGTMNDWMYGELGATSFTIELRPRSGSGFVLPPAEIKPTCDEALAAVLALRASRHLRDVGDSP